MCNLSQSVEERGVEKGMKIGMEEGRKEGLIIAVERLMEDTGWPLERAISALKVPREQWEKYSNQPKQK